MREFYIELLKIVWVHIPKFTKIAALIIFAEMTAVIMVANPQDRSGLVIAFVFMLPFILLVFFMSIIEPNKNGRRNCND